mgnify:CR=1 FL=1
MENSAKAIIIAGGMFILIMVITLLVIFGRSLSSYMQDQHDKEMVKLHHKHSLEHAHTLL